MNWYHARDGKQDGPHSDETMRDLGRSGMINAATLVWREGMNDWQPLSKAAPHLLAGAAIFIAKYRSRRGHLLRVWGSFSPNGASGNQPVQGVRPLQAIAPAEDSEGMTMGNRTAQLDRLLKIAKAQRGLNVVILAVLLFYAATIIFMVL